ncbi:MAG: Gfo/Idh/MocA family protein [Candidatus Methylomirabilota bacterium]
MRRMRVGVIGCGLIAQVMHLPHLKELHELFEVVALCDVSPGTLKYVGDYYGVTKRFTDYRDLLKAPLEAVAVFSADSHGQVMVDSLKAGKHVFAEKPMCYTLREADEILAAHKKAGTTCMIAYMKRYDPGFRYAQPLIRRLKKLQTIHITILEDAAQNQLAHHDIQRFSDVPANVRASLQADQHALIREAIGDFTPLEGRIFGHNLLSTMVHHINLLRALSGDPEEVLFTDVWQDGLGTVTCLRYASGVRAIVSLQYLPDLAHFEETLVYYGQADRIRLVFPSPFFRNTPTPVFLEGMEDGRFIQKQVIASMKEAFKEELLHFAECVQEGKTPITTPEEAKGDVALLHKIFKAIKRPLK